MSKLSHIDEKGLPTMVDVSAKASTSRHAVAVGFVKVGQEILEEITTGGPNLKKGPVIQTAVLAGQMAVKRTSDVIPLCHPLPISGCSIEVDVENKDTLKITCKVSCNAQTGVEMEALHGVSVAALTIYDMVKAMSHDLVIENIHLVEKKGGKSDYAR